MRPASQRARLASRQLAAGRMANVGYMYARSMMMMMMMVFYCPSKESPLPISHILSPKCSELNTSIYRSLIEAISFTSSLS